METEEGSSILYLKKNEKLNLDGVKITFGDEKKPNIQKLKKERGATEMSKASIESLYMYSEWWLFLVFAL